MSISVYTPDTNTNWGQYQPEIYISWYRNGSYLYANYYYLYVYLQKYYGSYYGWGTIAGWVLWVQGNGTHGGTIGMNWFAWQNVSLTNDYTRMKFSSYPSSGTGYSAQFDVDPGGWTNCGAPRQYTSTRIDQYFAKQVRFMPLVNADWSAIDAVYCTCMGGYPGTGYSNMADCSGSATFGSYYGDNDGNTANIVLAIDDDGDNMLQVGSLTSYKFGDVYLWSQQFQDYGITTDLWEHAHGGIEVWNSSTGGKIKPVIQNMNHEHDQWICTERHINKSYSPGWTSGSVSGAANSAIYFNHTYTSAPIIAVRPRSDSNINKSLVIFNGYIKSGESYTGFYLCGSEATSTAGAIHLDWKVYTTAIQADIVGAAEPSNAAGEYGLALYTHPLGNNFTNPGSEIYFTSHKYFDSRLPYVDVVDRIEGAHWQSDVSAHETCNSSSADWMGGTSEFHGAGYGFFIDRKLTKQGCWCQFGCDYQGNGCATYALCNSSNDTGCGTNYCWAEVNYDAGFRGGYSVTRSHATGAVSTSGNAATYPFYAINNLSGGSGGNLSRMWGGQGIAGAKLLWWRLGLSSPTYNSINLSMGQTVRSGFVEGNEYQDPDYPISVAHRGVGGNSAVATPILVLEPDYDDRWDLIGLAAMSSSTQPDLNLDLLSAEGSSKNVETTIEWDSITNATVYDVYVSVFKMTDMSSGIQSDWSNARWEKLVLNQAQPQTRHGIKVATTTGTSYTLENSDWGLLGGGVTDLGILNTGSGYEPGDVNLEPYVFGSFSYSSGTAGTTTVLSTSSTNGSIDEWNLNAKGDNYSKGDFVTLRENTTSGAFNAIGEVLAVEDSKWDAGFTNDILYKLEVQVVGKDNLTPLKATNTIAAFYGTTNSSVTGATPTAYTTGPDDQILITKVEIDLSSLPNPAIFSRYTLQWREAGDSVWSSYCQDTDIYTGQSSISWSLPQGAPGDYSGCAVYEGMNIYTRIIGGVWAGLPACYNNEECFQWSVLGTGYIGDWDFPETGSPGGPGGSCFTGDQLITMADNSLLPIKYIQVGDFIKAYNEETEETDSGEVKEIKEKIHDDVYTIILDNFKELTPTGNHPFLTKDKGWTTIDEHNPNHAGGNKKLVAGDFIKDIHKGWVKVLKVQKMTGDILTYNFIDMKYGTIIADGIVTHTTLITRKAADYSKLDIELEEFN